MPVPTSPVRPVPSTVRLVRTWPSWRTAAVSILLLSALGISVPSGFPLVAPVVAALVVKLAPSQAPGCGRPWTTWAIAYRGNVAAVRASCAVQAVDQPHRRASLGSVATNPNQVVERRVIAVRMLSLDEASGPSIETILQSPDTPRMMRRSLATVPQMGRSPLPLSSLAQQVAIDGLFDLALLADADPFSPENDSESTFPPELEALARTVNAPERTMALALLQARRTTGSFRAGAAPSTAQSADASRVEPLPAPLDELAAFEGLAHHLREEYAAVHIWITADFGSRASRFLRAAISHGDGEYFAPPDASIHRVLRGENAAPALAALTLLAMAEKAELPAYVVASGEGFVLNLPNSAVFISRCGARRVAPARQGSPIRESEIILRARREIAARILSSDSPSFGDRVTFAREASGTDPSSPLGRVLAELPGYEIDNIPTSIDPTADPTADPIVAFWLLTRGEPERARAFLTTPTTGHAERVRVQTLLALGEPVAAQPIAPDGCQSAELPWPPG